MKKCFLVVVMGLLALFRPLAGLAAEVTIPLTSGWNLLNLPLQPDATSVQAVLAGSSGVSVTSAWKWQGNTWAVFLPAEEVPGAYAQSKQFAVLSTITAGQGFWLNCQGEGQLLVSGQPPTAEALQLTAGWNLLGLKQGEATTVANLFSSVKAQIISVWAWQGTTWAVSLPGEADDGAAYAAGKQFGHLNDIQPLMGFWVNASEATGAFPPAVGKVLARVNGTLTPVAAAEVFLNNQLIATSDHQGLFHYPAVNSLTVTVKASGFVERTGLLAATSVRSYFWLDQPPPEPEFSSDTVDFGKVKAKTLFKEYPNLLIMEASVAESAKPAPKEVSDGTAALTITDMSLTKDITVAVTTFANAEESKVSAALASLAGGAQTSHLIGGADVAIKDSKGADVSLAETGFGGKVRATLKAFNLSAGAMTLAAMQTTISAGTGAITLFSYQDQTWQVVGKGVIVAKDGGHIVQSAPGVVMDGLYPFLFIYAGKKVVHGQVVSGGEPVANALITLHGSDDSAVTLADGSFALSVPDLLPQVALTVVHESYALAKATATFMGSAQSTAIGTVALTPLPQVAIHGLLTDQQQQTLAGTTVTLRFSQVPPNILFPLAITVTSDGQGGYLFPTVPAALLPAAGVEVTTAGGYHLALDQPLPAAVEGEIVYDISLVAPLWVHATGGNLYGAPVVADGSVYLGGVDGRMRRLDAESGEELWSIDTHRPIFATPALDSEHLYFGTVGNQLWALERSGGAQAFAPLEVNPWGTGGNMDIIASPALEGGVLSFGGNDDTLYFFGSDGQILNADNIGNNITGSAAVAANTLYFGGWDGHFYAYPASGNGLQLSRLWQFPAEGEDPLPARILSSPVVAGDKVYFGGGNNLTLSLTDADGIVTPYAFTQAGDHQTAVFSENVASWSMTVTAEDKTLYCLHADDGTLAWQFTLDGAVVGRPAIMDQTLFVATLSGTVTALDLTAAPQVGTKWTFTSGGAVYSTPVVAGGRVYFGSEDHWLYCLDAATGTQLWAMKTGGKIIATPVVADGKVYAASLDGSLYCIAE